VHDPGHGTAVTGYPVTAVPFLANDSIFRTHADLSASSATAVSGGPRTPEIAFSGLGRFQWLSRIYGRADNHVTAR
jgi:hypothetical protein